MRGALCVATRLYILYVAADESTSGWEFYCIPKSPHMLQYEYNLLGFALQLKKEKRKDADRISVCSGGSEIH